MSASTPRNRPAFSLPVHLLIRRWRPRIKAGSLTLRLGGEDHVILAGRTQGPAAVMELHRPASLIRRVLQAGDLGFAESYLSGDWDTPDLTTLKMLGLANEATLRAALQKPALTRMSVKLRHMLRANTRSGSRRNIRFHYDLGNDFYRCWLDESMTYSAALFERPEDSLATAQRAKYLRLASKLNLQPGDHVLEIGCGWGGFAEIAATEFGCRVVGLTLSEQQAAYARQRMQSAGVADRVEIRLQDYRDTTENFDKIASIEMFEAVGAENWPVFFERLRQRLKPEGRAGLQIITMDENRFDAYRRNPDFIQRYIFPGGMLPSRTALRKTAAAAGLHIADSFFFGPAYAETLRRWRAAFEKELSVFRAQGFSEKFLRMWRYYLCYCEAGFDAGRIDVGQFVLHRA